MLVFNMRRVFALRGIDKPFMFLTKNGFASSTASNMLQFYPVVFKIKSLEKLCLALNCTPNDLFEWRDDKDDALHEKHALNNLRKAAVTAKLSDIVRDLPLEKMSEVETFLENLQKAESRPE
ncbi:MAG TPA: helix-turn-helix transcriptional regulator [Pyrinomonadaceae bacterium]